MMRLLFCFLLLATGASPIPPAYPAPELLGQWLRVNDLYEGMQIEVLWENGQLNGRIILLPTAARNTRFHPGDIKWKNIQPAANSGFLFGSLVISLDGQGNIQERRYDDSSLSFFSKDEIHTHTLIFRADKSGNFQQWVRIQPI